MENLLSKKLADCDLSVRTLCCLKGAGIETVGDLCRYSRSDLLRMRNFGKKSIMEIEDFLQDNKIGWDKKYKQ